MVLLVKLIELLPKALQGSAALAILILAVPYLQVRYMPNAQFDGDTVNVKPVKDWDSPLAQRTANLVGSTANLVANLESGSSPRDAEHVPYWHKVISAIEIHTHAMNTNTGALRTLAAELEDEAHRRPLNTHTTNVKTNEEPARGLLTQIQRWWSS
jgi:hypothetical protein